MVLPKNRAYPFQEFDDPAPIAATTTNKLVLVDKEDPDIKTHQVAAENEQLSQRIKYVVFTQNLETAKPEWTVLPPVCACCYSRLISEGARRLIAKNAPICRYMPATVKNNLRSTFGH